MLKLIYANITQNSLQALSLGGECSLMTLTRSPLYCMLATSNPFPSASDNIQSKENYFDGKGKTTVYNSHLMMSPKQGPGHSCLKRKGNYWLLGAITWLFTEK